MSSPIISWLLLLAALLHASILLPTQVLCLNDKESNLLNGLNAYRISKNLKPFPISPKAACVASQFAEKYDHTSKCLPVTSTSPVPFNDADTIFGGADFNSTLKICRLDPKIKRDGIIMPVCVPGLDQAAVLSNYTDTIYANYLGDRKYLRAGIGSDKDWMVVLLTEDMSKYNKAAPPNANSASIIWPSCWMCHRGIIN